MTTPSIQSNTSLIYHYLSNSLIVKWLELFTMSHQVPGLLIPGVPVWLVFGRMISWEHHLLLTIPHFHLGSYWLAAVIPIWKLNSGWGTDLLITHHRSLNDRSPLSEDKWTWGQQSFGNTGVLMGWHIRNYCIHIYIYISKLEVDNVMHHTCAQVNLGNK